MSLTWIDTLLARQHAALEACANEVRELVGDAVEAAPDVATVAGDLAKDEVPAIVETAVAGVAGPAAPLVDDALAAGEKAVEDDAPAWAKALLGRIETIATDVENLKANAGVGTPVAAAGAAPFPGGGTPSGVVA